MRIVKAPSENGFRQMDAQKREHGDSSDNSQENSQKSENAADLIASFELSGDVALLYKAQKLFPNNLQVVLASCLLARSPDSEWLMKLEKMQPDSAVPNLVRAGLYAERGDIRRSAAELEVALSKDNLSTNARLRQANLLDQVLLGNASLPSTLTSSLDDSFFQHLQAVNGMLANNPRIFGDEAMTASRAVALASKLRKLGDFGLSYSMMGNNLESQLLRNLNVADEYGDAGKTVGQRQIELSAQLTQQEKLASEFKSLIDPDSADPTLRLQFYAHMRSDGEQSAIRWLINSQRKLANLKK